MLRIGVVHFFVVVSSSIAVGCGRGTLANDLASASIGGDFSASLSRHDETPALTLLWSQEFAGLDLAREIVQTFDPDKNLIARIGTIESINPLLFAESAIDPALRAKLPLFPVTKRSHGDHTGAILAGTQESASSRGRFFAANAERYDFEGGLAGLGNSIRSLHADGKPELDVFSYSVDLKFGSEKLDVLNRSSTLLFQSAGNDYPHYRNKSHVLTASTFMVSNVSPLGLTAVTSSESETAIVGAPASNLQRIPVGGEVAHFGGTSGATPLVAGLMADVRAILPGLTRGEARILLERTALPTALGPNSGVGSVNGYKLMIVATSLARGWPANRAQITESATYDHRGEAADIAVEAERRLDNANDKSAILEAMTLLRRSFFLDPTSMNTKRRLGSFYRDAGFGLNALFYESLGHLNPDELLELFSVSDFVPVWGDVLRRAQAFPNAKVRFSAAAAASMKSTSFKSDEIYVRFAKEAARSGIDPLVLLRSGLDVGSVQPITDELRDQIEKRCTKLIGNDEEILSPRATLQRALIAKSFQIIDSRDDHQVERLSEILAVVILDSLRQAAVRRVACDEFSE